MQAKCAQRTAFRPLQVLRTSVIYKDEHVIALNKPYNLAVQGGSKVSTHRHRSCSLLGPIGPLQVRRSVDSLASLAFGLDEAPRLVHRLDRSTSGVLVLARTQEAARHLAAAFALRSAESMAPDARSPDASESECSLSKVYWALLQRAPSPRAGRVDVRIHRVSRVDGTESMEIDSGAQAACGSQRTITEYKTVQTDSKSGYAWCELRPLTGRKHQLRIVCAQSLGAPIVGDYKYGFGSPRQKQRHDDGQQSTALHLHCYSITVPLPPVEDGRAVRLEAQLPAHMERSWSRLGWGSAAATKATVRSQ